MIDEFDNTITMGDHVHLRLPFRNTSGQTITDAVVEMSGAYQTETQPGVFVHNGAFWLNRGQTVALTPSSIGPGDTGFADFWIFVTNNDPEHRQSLHSNTWLGVRTGDGEWTIHISLSPIRFSISGNEAMRGPSCLHNPHNFDIRRYAQYAAGAPSMSPTPSNAGDPDTPEQAVRNVVARVHEEFGYGRGLWAQRVSDTLLLGQRHGNIGVCRDYADLTTSLLRSLGLPARYTRATLRFEDEEEHGSSTGHAWAEAYLGAQADWAQADSGWDIAIDQTSAYDSTLSICLYWTNKKRQGKLIPATTEECLCLPCLQRL